MREADVGSPSADTGRAISDHRISCPGLIWRRGSQSLMGNFGGSNRSSRWHWHQPRKGRCSDTDDHLSVRANVSELPLKADMRRLRRHVRKVPEPDSCTATNRAAIRSPRRRCRSGEFAPSASPNRRSIRLSFTRRALTYRRSASNRERSRKDTGGPVRAHRGRGRIWHRSG